MAAPPQFASSPNQFKPQRGRHAGEANGSDVHLFGSHFDVNPVSVRFGDVEAEVLSTSASGIAVAVPAMAAGPTKITVTTPDGSATSDDDFRVSSPPLISELDPFGFSRDPSGRNISIHGAHFIIDDGDEVRVVCRLEPRFNPEVQVELSFVDLSVLSLTPTTIVAGVPAIANFDEQFVGGHGSISVNCSDGATAESERWSIEGL